MSVFGENTIGGRVALDITGSYPTGLMAALGVSYNDPQELINAQLRYTAAQVDINAQLGAQYSQTNLDIEKTANIAATTLETQIAANNYKNASYEVNLANQSVSDLANIAYSNAYSVYKICSDASYLAYLTHEASRIITDRVETEIVTASVGKYVPDVNPIDTPTLSTISTLVGNRIQGARNDTIFAQTSALQYLFKTQNILGNAIVKSNTVTHNLQVVSGFDTLVKRVIDNIADPLNSIAGKESLITQYVPSVPVNNAIQVANIAIAFINGCIKAYKDNVTTNSDITTNATASTNLASSFDSIARVKDANMYLATATSRQMFNTASTMKSLGSIISIPNEYPYDPYRVTLSSINISNAATKIANDADISAENARSVSNAILSLKAAFERNMTPQPSVYAKAISSLKTLTDMMATVKKVTSNSSAHSAIAITRRASNTINGQLSHAKEQEALSISASNDSNDLLIMIRHALSTAVVTEINRTQLILWAVNAAKGKSEEISEKAKERAHVLSRTAHNLVTPQTIAVQTASANRLGALNNNNLSRLDRLSRNVPVDPPPAYKSFNAGIRAKTLQPIRPTLTELVYKNRLAPLRLDSLRTITATKVKIAEEVQRINDTSAFSFRQQ